MHIPVEIIEGCIRRKSSCEFKLYKLIFSYLMGICIRYTRSEDKAKDMVNVGFLKILNHLPKYDHSLPFKNWIRRIMVNALIDEFRKEKKHLQNLQFVEEFGSYYDFQNVDNEGVHKLSTEDILKIMNRLPENTARIFNLYVIDGFTHREIADMLDISEGTSKWHVNLAREKLKKYFSALHYNYTPREKEES